jgi:2-keto-3-deoxy-L-rhamnonate aldolase RhmA
VSGESASIGPIGLAGYAAAIDAFRARKTSGILRGARCEHGHLPAIGVMARAGLDYIYLDQQHGTVTTESVYTIVSAVARFGMAVLVRVPDQSARSIGLVLDAGAHGVIVPDVETAEQAERIVAATRYPPGGTRSWGAFAFNASPYTSDGARPICLPMVESQIAVANAGAIARVEGVDGIYVGRFDLALALDVGFAEIGRPGRHTDSVESVRRACESAGVLMGTSGTPAELIPLGYRLLTIGSELGLLASGLGAALRDS